MKSLLIGVAAAGILAGSANAANVLTVGDYATFKTAVTFLSSPAIHPSGRGVQPGILNHMVPVGTGMVWSATAIFIDPPFIVNLISNLTAAGAEHR